MGTEMKAPLYVEGLCKSYPSFQLKDVSFSLERGKITGFIGRNGAGKTTTINSVLSLVKPDEGTVLFSGLSDAEHSREIREKIGFVSAGMTYYTRKKLRVITGITKSFYPGWNDDTYRTFMESFGLDEEKIPAELSNGMKIKYALALALSHGADLLILDEPTSGLDPVSREELMELFLNLKDQGKTIFYSTHITSDLDKTADNILYLAGGKLKADGSMEDVIGAYRVVHYQEVPEALRGKLIGQRREKNGYSALLPAEEAEKTVGVEPAPANLDEIMIHLEKEG